MSVSGFRRVCSETFYIDQPFQRLLSKLDGFGEYGKQKFNERFECFSWYKPNEYDSAYSLSAIKQLQSFYVNNLSIKKQQEFNIGILDLILSYRGWRHMKGLPVRGQRTHSNASSSYTSNLVLRRLRIVFAKRVYGELPMQTLNMAILAEQVNAMWRVQWAREWRRARKKRVLFLRKRKTNNLECVVDLASAAKGMVGNYSTRKNQARQKKKVATRNTFMIGFDIGFARQVLNQLEEKRIKQRAKFIKQKAQTITSVVKKKKKR